MGYPYPRCFSRVRASFKSLAFFVLLFLTCILYLFLSLSLSLCLSIDRHSFLEIDVFVF